MNIMKVLVKSLIMNIMTTNNIINKMKTVILILSHMKDIMMIMMIIIMMIMKNIMKKNIVKVKLMGIVKIIVFYKIYMNKNKKLKKTT